ncbi:MAG: LysR substrate-binding domain-containing protein, partial [Boseongicola sp.]|nr:LysR substrate-binding domain-containing protein [Boseongicola sp.]
PKVAMKISEGTNEVLIPSLLSGKIDMVVGRLSRLRYRERITREKLIEDRIVAVVGPEHPLAGKPDVSFDQIRPYGWLLPPLETTLRRQVDQFFVNQQHYVPPRAIESVSYLANRALLQSRDLICLMPEEVTAQDVGNGNLVRLDWTVPFGRGPIGISLRADDSLSPAARAFKAALHEVAAERGA